MARRKFSAGRVLEVLSSGRSSFRGRDERVTLRVHVDPSCPRELALAARGALMPERENVVVEVLGPGAAPAGSPAPDAVVVLPGGEGCEALVASYARSGVPVCALVETALDAPRVELPEQAAALVGVVAASDAAVLPDKLSAWLVDVVDRPLALAAGLPFCRGVVVDRLVARCATENAFVGAVSLIPGSDLPIMTANQAKLALDMAAAYGCEIDLSRAAELVGVVGAGLVYRSVARTLVGLVPGVGALLKAGVGYGGTMATGSALRLRFEAGDLGLADLLRRDSAATGSADAPGAGAPAEPGGSGSQALPSGGPSDDYVTIESGRA